MIIYQEFVKAEIHYNNNNIVISDFMLFGYEQCIIRLSDANNDKYYIINMSSDVCVIDRVNTRTNEFFCEYNHNRIRHFDNFIIGEEHDNKEIENEFKGYDEYFDYINPYYKEYDTKSLFSYYICVYTESIQVKIVFYNENDYNKFVSIIIYYKEWFDSGFDYSDSLFLRPFKLDDFSLAYIKSLKNGSDYFNIVCRIYKIDSEKRKEIIDKLQKLKIIRKLNGVYEYNKRFL